MLQQMGDTYLNVVLSKYTVKMEVHGFKNLKVRVKKLGKTVDTKTLIQIGNQLQINSWNWQHPDLDTADAESVDKLVPQIGEGKNGSYYHFDGYLVYGTDFAIHFMKLFKV